MFFADFAELLIRLGAENVLKMNNAASINKPTNLFPFAYHFATFHL